MCQLVIKKLAKCQKNSNLLELAEILHGQWVGYVDFKNIYFGWGGAAGEGHAFEVADRAYLPN